MSKRMIQIIIGSVLSITLLIGLALSGTGVRALSEPLPELSGINHSLKILLEYKDGEKAAVPVSGATIAIYRVADIYVENGVLRYKLTPSFADSGVQFEQMNAAQSSAAAKKLAQNRTQKDATAVMITNESGQVEFEQLSDGMYLVAQISSAKTAKEYEPIAPYLVMVPELKKVDGNYKWDSRVISIPKTEIKKTAVPNDAKDSKRTSGSSPKTGDDNHPEIYIVTALLSAALLINLVLRRKNSN